MRVFVLLYFLFFLESLFSQIPKDVKYDQLVYSYDSLTAVVIKGKTSGVYNFQTKDFSVTPSKNSFFNFPNTNAYAEFSAKDGSISIHWISLTDHLSVKGSDSSCYIGFLPQTSQNIVSLNGKLFDRLTGDFKTGVLDEEKLETQVKIEKLKNGHFLITNYQSGHVDSFFDRYVPGYNLSGVFDLNLNKFLIDPLYKRCYVLNRFVFCLKESSISGFRSDAQLPLFHYSYDIYALRQDTALYDFYYEDIIQLDESKMTEVLAVGITMAYSEDGIHCIYPIENKFGFARFQLFEDVESNIPHFVFQPILPPVYDFIAFSGIHQKLITLKDFSSKELEIYHLFYGKEKDSLQYLSRSNGMLEYFDRNPTTVDDDYLVSTDTSIVALSEATGSIVLQKTENTPPPFFPNFGLKLLQDSMIVIHNYRDEILADYPYVTSTGEDSIEFHWDGSAHLVYPVLAGYFGHSGVFDLKTGDWHISPAVVTIAGGQSGFIYKHPVKIDNDMSKVFFSYGISKGPESGNWRFIDEQTFEKDPMLYRFAYSGLAADTVFSAPNGFYQHHEFQGENSKVYYMVADKQMGIYSPGNDFWNQLSDKTFEFVHYNPTLDIYFYLQGDSIYFSSPFCEAAVSKKSGKIIFQQPDIYGDPVYMYQLILIEGKDTIITGESLDEYRTGTTCSITILDDVLIVNDNSEYVEKSRTEEFIGEEEMITDRITFESENSSIWRKNANGNWIKISPYYASIQPIPMNQYIARSGWYSYIVDSYQGPSDPKGKTIEARYFILDSNLLAKSYLDYFDFADVQDLGFGLMVKLNEGDKYFFMTYNLVAVTNAEWDRFELENGKLKAIIDTKYEIDPETGELIYNEYGAPNELVSSTTKYFKLP
jgi:hypothetical protein